MTTLQNALASIAPTNPKVSMAVMGMEIAKKAKADFARAYERSFSLEADVLLLMNALDDDDYSGNEACKRGFFSWEKNLRELKVDRASNFKALYQYYHG